MRTELRLVPHSILFDMQIIEVWHDGQLLATIYGAEEPGVRVISKHHMVAIGPVGPVGEPAVVEVRIRLKETPP